MRSELRPHQLVRCLLLVTLGPALTAVCTRAPSALGDAAAETEGGASQPPGVGEPPRFSFFVASLAAMQRLSGSQSGFGGDLRFGQPDGLAGADEICRQVAEGSLPGSGAKGWRAFLSATKGPDGNPVHAIDRVGQGPWYDRLGRVVALSKDDLAQPRPRGADPIIVNDLPNEEGVPNHSPDGVRVDNHDILTGSDARGRLYREDWSVTCHDWTSSVGSDGKPRVGHSWPRGPGDSGPGGGGFSRADGGGLPPGGGFTRPDAGGSSRPDGGGFPPRGGGPGGGLGDLSNWMSSLDEAGCAPGVNLIEMGPPNPNNPTVGSGGGYGGIYCLALVP